MRRKISIALSTIAAFGFAARRVAYRAPRERRSLFSLDTSATKTRQNQSKPMKKSVTCSVLIALLALAATPAINRAQDSAERAKANKEKIQAMREETVKIRRQIEVTMEELRRLTVKDVDLRPQFEKFKGELTKMEGQAKVARDRADAMKAKGAASFAEWEKEVESINDEDIRNEAAKRMAKRQKSYNAILTSMTDAKEELVPFMSNLRDVQKLLDSELTQSTVNSTKTLIRKTGWNAEDVRNSLADVEKELDRVSGELAKYK
jgi:chromosome segregation ATPase